MSKCARCGKTVYPTEELKCLDKLWHKGCFKCDECGMSLNMKNYKGYNKLPYCNAHCPQVKPTTVADTPESRRLAENTRIQSNVKYHEDFEKAKGKVTQVADDPETMRIRNASKMISNVAYHGDLAKKKAMEDKRAFLPNDSANGVENHVPPQQVAAVPAFKAPPPLVASTASAVPRAEVPTQSQSQYTLQPGRTATPTRGRIVAAVDPNENHEPRLGGATVTADNIRYSSKQSTVIYNSSEQGPVHELPSRKIGSIADYDPLNHNYGTTASSAFRNEQYAFHGAHPPSPQLQLQQQHLLQQQLQIQQHHAQQQQQQHQQHLHHQVHQQQQQLLQQQQQQQLQYQQQQHQQVSLQAQHQPVHLGHLAANSSSGPALQQMRAAFNFRAIYDYTAQDVDEVSFQDGDLIVNCMPIDEGWMTGTVQKTGQRGMLPANYVEAMH